MKFLIYFILIFSIKTSFAFNFKINTEKDILKFMVDGTEHGLRYNKFLVPLMTSKGYSSIKITQISCTDKKAACSKELKKWSNVCQNRIHELTYQAVDQKQKLIKGKITIQSLMYYDGPTQENCEGLYTFTFKNSKGKSRVNVKYE